MVGQPAVSRQIALLERHLGAPLLVRTRGGVEPTQAGQLLVDHAVAILDRLALAEVQVQALTAEHTGTVDDPVKILLPANHRLARSPVIAPADLAADTWIRAHDGSAADLAEHVLARHRLDPPRLLAGHGDEPVETQALVAAGRGIALTHELTVIINQRNIVSRPLEGERFVQHIAVSHATGPLAPAVRTVRDAIQRVGRLHQT
jgi:DNA-binding transcriptional LysR family regulator